MNIDMNVEHKRGYIAEMEQAKRAYRNGSFDSCFRYLERAHILGQRNTRMHFLSHWWMLKVAVRTINGKEIVGQILRIFASIVFSWLWVPLGNTGGANISAFKPMPIPEEFKKYFVEHE